MSSLSILVKELFHCLSGTFGDLETLFNNLAGIGKWQASNPETGVSSVRVDDSITKIVDNLVTDQNEFIGIDKTEGLLVVWEKDPAFLSFLSSALASGVKLNILEE